MRGPYYDDVWSWDGPEWREWPRTSVTPPGRGGGSLLFDHDHDRFVYFGGYDTGLLRDLWVYARGHWERVSAADASGTP
jgi:hypothetical protein